ncbi:MAG: hypothetical protein JWO32_1659 [Bacteroidetes bacterium]|nr:hypothetical protein [Bacteroidota bacterium]
MKNIEVKKQNDVIVNFKTVTNKLQNENIEGFKKVKFVTVEVNEHESDYGLMFSIDLNYREQWQEDFMLAEEDAE